MIDRKQTEDRILLAISQVHSGNMTEGRAIAQAVMAVIEPILAASEGMREAMATINNSRAFSSDYPDLKEIAKKAIAVFDATQPGAGREG